MNTSEPSAPVKALGTFLRDRRSKLDPASFGYGGRRRTPGLRREEVAQRANISVTWYTWLERGRGGSPSGEVLNRIALALMLTDAEREHLFLLGLGRPPEARLPTATGVTPRLQRLLEALPDSPAYIRTLSWNLLAWNEAAAAVFGYNDSTTFERNILRRPFCELETQALQTNWDSLARFVVSAFRSDAARAGKTDAAAEVRTLVDELCRRSPMFATLWQSHEVHTFGEGTKVLRLPGVGALRLEYSAFVVDGRPDLGMVIFNPATLEDRATIRGLVERL
jgi:transcriptional regulator with XRE-family HTH domain